MKGIKAKIDTIDGNRLSSQATLSLEKVPYKSIVCEGVVLPLSECTARIITTRSSHHNLFFSSFLRGFLNYWKGVSPPPEPTHENKIGVISI